MIATEILRSPCCGEPLLPLDAARLSCATCPGEFAIRPFGPDLMPPALAATHASYQQWTDVQTALQAWRKRTWTNTPDAAVKTDRARLIGRAFVDWAGLTGSVLDVGCGGGWLRELMPDAVYHGLDPMPADQPYPFPFARGVADRLPFPSAMFDTCCFFSSIDYAIDIDATLAEARRVLKPGGRLAISGPVHVTKHTDGERLHNYRFLPGELARLVAGHFEDVEVFEFESAVHFIRARR